ncbi:tetratricopeptide repeat protein, partial [Candidatus Peregrinibacteria bacterium]|nr:tetratricopeptide repeat protein [Candidatus Peregrinibacteria bacterium]
IVIALLMLGGSMLYWHIYKPAYADILFNEHRDFYEDGVIEEALSFAPYSSYYHYGILIDGFGDYRNIDSIQLIEGKTTRSMLWDAITLSNTEPDEAEEIFQELIRINPDNAEFLFDYARFLYDEERYEEAVFYFEKFLEIVPEFWRWKFELNEKTDYEVAQYEIFLRNSKDFETVFDYLVDASKKSGQYEKALEYEVYIQESP